jgi:ABC-type lipoprotein release transport system permease subunit
VALSVAGITAAIGLIIALLSIIIVLVTLQLLVSRRQPEIDILLQLGYRPATISRLFVRQAAKLLGLSLSIGLLLFATSAYLLYWWMSQFGFTITPSTLLMAVVPGIVLCAAAILPIRYGVQQAIAR